MIPNIPLLTQDITEITYPSRTYKIVFNPENHKGITQLNVYGVSRSTDLEPEKMDRINGYIDDIDSVIQAIYLILMTERYKFLIYSWDFGVELVDLFGKPMPYVMSELPRRITEALTMDNRIEDVTDFKFTVNGKKLHTTFTVITNVGNFSTELEVVV